MSRGIILYIILGQITGIPIWVFATWNLPEKPIRGFATWNLPGILIRTFAHPSASMNSALIEGSISRTICRWGQKTIELRG